MRGRSVDGAVRYAGTLAGHVLGEDVNSCAARGAEPFLERESCGPAVLAGLSAGVY